MLKKIKNAAFQGELFVKSIYFICKSLRKLFFKSIHFIYRFPGNAVRQMDWILGCIIRGGYAVFARVNENQIMFINFQGDYTCNPKYIYEEMRKRGLKYDIVFSARRASMKREDAFPSEVSLVEQYSAEYYQHLAKSKLIVANSVEFLKKAMPKKSKQVLIETWHGSLGIKRFDADSNSGKSWVSAAKRCGKRADYIISNSTFEDNVYRDSFWKTTPILHYGHPRNDLLFLCNDKLQEEIREKVLINHDESCQHRFALYAPTFRDSHKLSYYKIDFEKLIQVLSERFGGEWSILVRLHPTIRRNAKRYLKAAGDRVIDVTAYPDIQELMVISDVAITDYSSWIYDFILTKKPGFIFATDIKSYVTERGFYYPLEETPFLIAKNNEELFENIMRFDEGKYQLRVEEFLASKGCIDDGQASLRVVDKIVEIMGGGAN